MLTAAAPTPPHPSYVCGTRSDAAGLTHDSMGRHDPGGALLCVHSVCIAAPHRRRGVATK